jgi:hypothetical protein
VRSCPRSRVQDALGLVHLYAERGSPKFEAAARRRLARYIQENSPRLRDLAKVVTSLAQRDFE